MLHQLVELLPERAQPYAKAVVAGLLGAVAPFVLAGLLTNEWDKAAIVGAVAGFLLGPSVGATPNLPNAARDVEAPKDLRQAGYADTTTIIAVCALVVAILAIAGVSID